jgi:hypothetical protein
MRDLLKQRILNSLIPSYITEGIGDEGTPDMKYYSFDWDDNIAYMPTQIILVDEDGNEIGMSTEDFAEYRTEIGKKPFEYNNNVIVDFADDPFRNFRTEGDKQFLIDSMKAETGPAWNDFVEAINSGSIFSIITARGHNPETLKDAVYNMIVSNHNGIDMSQLVKNLRKYREIADMDDMSDDELVRWFLNMCRFYPVSFGSGSAQSPEEGKIRAMEEFISYIKKTAKRLHKKAYVKNRVSNKFVLPKIGFSDDDIRNVEKMKAHFEKGDKESPIQTYLTAGGKKRKF